MQKHTDRQCVEFWNINLYYYNVSSATILYVIHSTIDEKKRSKNKVSATLIMIS